MNRHHDQFRWLKLDDAIENRIQQVQESWIGTQYMAGQRAKRIGVDCLQLVGGVLDELFRRTTPTHIPRLPSTSGLQFKGGGFRTSLAVRKQFPSRIERNGRIEPGDVIVTTSTLDASAPNVMGHLALAGVRPWTFLHAVAGVGVCWTSLQGLPGLVRLYRVRSKESWA